MNYFLIQAITVADIGAEENSFWMQIMVFLVVAVAFGIYTLTKSNQSEHTDQQHEFTEQTRTGNLKSRLSRLLRKPADPQKSLAQKYIAGMKAAEPKLDFAHPVTAERKNPKNKPAALKNKNLQSGMELLELDFLLSVVENTSGNNKNDVTMRRLNFNELSRRGKLSQVNSRALTVYAVNAGNLYGKDIQCKAMGQLAERTTSTNRQKIPIRTVPPKRRMRKRLNEIIK